MSTAPIVPTPTSTTVTVVTVTLQVTATVTAPPTPELFVNSYWGTLTCLDFLLFFTAVWTALIVGFNRLSIIPIVVCAAATVGNGLFFVAHRDVGMGKPFWHPVRYFFMQLGWDIFHFGNSFYTFFIVRLLLQSSPRRKKIFSWGYWILFAGEICSTFIWSWVTALDWKGTANNADKTTEHNVLPSGFMFLTVLEVWGAGFLISILYIGRQNTRRFSGGVHQVARVSLLQQLAQSTEIRLATLASVSIIRTGTGWAWFAVPGKGVNLVLQIDNFAYLMENVYPVLLIIDLLAARINGAVALDRTQPQISPGNVSPLMGGNSPRRTTGTLAQTMDSIRRDFGQYLGRSQVRKAELHEISVPSEGMPIERTISEATSSHLRSESKEDLSMELVSESSQPKEPNPVALEIISEHIKNNI